MAAAEQGSSGVARCSGDCIGRRPWGEAARVRDVQRSRAGPGRVAARCRAARTRPAAGGGGRCSGTGGARNKGEKGRGARVTHHEPILGVDLSGGWSEKRIDAREAELGLAPMAADGRVRVSANSAGEELR